MKNGLKNLLFYMLTIVVSVCLIAWIVRMGGRFEIKNIVPVKGGENFRSNGFSLFLSFFRESVNSRLAILLLQMVAILFTARIFGFLFVKMKQPSVIGEILAGIVLGPSIVGALLPRASSFLFSSESLQFMDVLSQMGLILFMFVIGMELDISEVKKKFKETVIISHAGIVVPFFFGTLAAYLTYPDYASKTTPFLSYALFIGISMSITAFPVLARIIQEKNLSKTNIGVLSLASAANGDVVAWCLLAAIIAVAKTGTFSGALYTIFFTLLFLLFMFFVMRPFLNLLGNIYHNKEVVTKNVIGLLLLILIACACVTEILGIHALFGAFMAGLVMPANQKFRRIFTERVEDVSVSLFLPLFFVSTGLKTQIGLIGSGREWLFCLMFIAVAIVGKIGGTSFAARFAGENWQDSLAMGTLMNARGLMELIVLNIGYEMNIIPPSIFVMLVIMTIVTTFMTGPLLNLVGTFFKNKLPVSAAVKSEENIFRVVMSFGRASSGTILLHLIDQIFYKKKKNLEVTALHYTVGTDVNPLLVEDFEKINFEPLREESELLGLKVNTEYKVTNDVASEIIGKVSTGNYDFLLVGAGISFYMKELLGERRAGFFRKYLRGILETRIPKHSSLLSPNALFQDKTELFVKDTHLQVGIFINRNFVRIHHVLVVLNDPGDGFLLEYAGNLVEKNQALVKEVEMPDLTQRMLIENDFMLITYPTWNLFSKKNKDLVRSIPSTLIIKEKNGENSIVAER